LTLFFDYKNNAISAEIKALNADEAKNKQIADLLNGLKSFGGAASAKNPAIGELLGNIEVSSAADHVKISANIPEELLTKLREAASKKAAEKTEGAEPEED
jgi:hypothetical protein